jgi:hypothetical protein
LLRLHGPLTKARPMVWQPRILSQVWAILFDENLIFISFKLICILIGSHLYQDWWECAATDRLGHRSVKSRRPLTEACQATLFAPSLWKYSYPPLSGELT